MTSRLMMWPGAAFLIWTVASFLSHFCGKELLKLGLDRTASVLLALGLSITQTGFCVFVAAVHTSVEENTGTAARCSLLILVTHFLATLTTNLSMVALHSTSTFTFKLLEPVVMAIAQYLAFKKPVSTNTVLSIPIIIAGAILFNGSSLSNLADFTGASLAFISSVFLAMRNVCFKTLESKSAEFTLRSSRHVRAGSVATGALAMLLFALLTFRVVPHEVAAGFILLSTSAVFHVIYTYFSTNVVLKVLDIVNHSLANITKRLLVVVLLYCTGRRHADVINMCGLLLCSFGLWVSFRDKLKSLPGEATQTWRFFLCLTIGAIILLTMANTGSVTVYPNTLRPNFTTERPVSGIRTEDLESIGLNARGVELQNDTLQIHLSEFLSWYLAEHPDETNLLAKHLAKSRDVIGEAQRVMIGILKELTAGAKYAMLMEIATYENKGDPAITMGEVMLLRKLNVTVVFYCSTSECNDSALDYALTLSRRYAADELVILMQGGGNIAMYPEVDEVRARVIQRFSRFKMIVFSQSVYFHLEANMRLCQKIYSNNSNLTLLIRDRQSLGVARSYFQGVRTILAPDLAFLIGSVPRSLPPSFDILWLKRIDHESSNYRLPETFGNFSVHVSDWWDWKTNRGETEMETAVLIASNGLSFLQRGRVVITDRLHGHILSTLLDIPHVIIDNPPAKKLSSFHLTWTAGLENVAMVTDAGAALTQAEVLLQKYSDALPEIVIYPAPL